MKAANTFILLLCGLIAFKVHAQTEIKYTPGDANKEYSGITKWNDLIILIPQKPQDNKFYALTEKQLHDAWKDSANGKTKNTIAAQEIITHHMPSFRDGFEATAIVNNSIYVTIETDTTDRFCYIIKGSLTIWNNTVTIDFSDQRLAIPKPKNAYNIGFESLVYLKEKDSLLADFEFNKFTGKPTACLVNKELTAYTPVTFDSSLFFRVTDINETDSNTILALNHYYADAYNLKKGKAYKCEYRNYEVENNEVAKHQMHDSDAATTSFTRIVELRLINDTISWKEKAVISYKNDNWEGIMPFDTGVLMIVDGNGFTPCRLIYFDLK